MDACLKQDFESFSLDRRHPRRFPRRKSVWLANFQATGTTIRQIFGRSPWGEAGGWREIKFTQFLGQYVSKQAELHCVKSAASKWERKRRNGWRERAQRRDVGRRWITSMSLRPSLGRASSLPSTLSAGQLRSCSTRRFTFVHGENDERVFSQKQLNWIYLTIRFPRSFWISRVMQRVSMGTRSWEGLERRDVYVHKSTHTISNERTMCEVRISGKNLINGGRVVRTLSSGFKREGSSFLSRKKEK